LKPTQAMFLHAEILMKTAITTQSLSRAQS
jgi:hypothetical protein